MAVVVVGIVHDGLLQFVDALEDAASDAFSGDLGKEPLDHVEPRAGRGREVQVKARMPLEPALHRGGLVGGSIARTRSSPATIRGQRIGPVLLPSSKPANCTASIRKPTSPTCSPSWSTSGLLRASTSSCPGPGRPSTPPTNSRRDPPIAPQFPAKKSSRQSRVIRGPLTPHRESDGENRQATRGNRPWRDLVGARTFATCSYTERGRLSPYRVVLDPAG